jgi:hypothetical protein
MIHNDMTVFITDLLQAYYKINYLGKWVYMNGLLNNFNFKTVYKNYKSM